MNNEQLIALICNHFDITVDQFKSSCRKANTCKARFMFIGLCYESLSLNQIAKLCNRSDHTTIIHGQKKFNDLVKNDTDFNNIWLIIQNEITKVNPYENQLNDLKKTNHRLLDDIDKLNATIKNLQDQLYQKPSRNSLAKSEGAEPGKIPAYYGEGGEISEDEYNQLKCHEKPQKKITEDCYYEPYEINTTQVKLKLEDFYSY